ncbi:hypothetical protein [Pantoea sp. 18069]|uniref:hypothetical protein n=1 Tax=Pantoea sp. 18069 TaxID=2681415 RepID=UPI00190FAF85|nr:hypothetical protein [Pantoea sp. 18069]
MFLSLQTAVALAAAGLLCACEPKPPVPKAAHAAGTLAAPVPLTTEDVSATAAVILKDQPVPMQPGASEAPASAGAPLEPLASLADSVGKYPYDGENYLEQGVLAARLRALLGDRYPLLLANMRTVSPLTADAGLWFITGNRPHEGGVEAGAVVIDPRTNALRVWLLNAGHSEEFIDPPAAVVPWPKDVQTLIDNQRRNGQ